MSASQETEIEKRREKQIVSSYVATFTNTLTPSRWDSSILTTTQVYTAKGPGKTLGL